MKRLLTLTVLALSLAACGSSSGGGGAADTLSCNLPAEGGCFTWSVPGAAISTYQATFNEECSASGGAAVSACPAASRVGRCAVNFNQGTTTLNIVFSYYSPTYTTAAAQADCVGEGTTFTAN